jgi:predicted phosphate transport protein (TIGR00153 family)
MKIFPKEIDFFEIFDRASLNVTKSASLLVALLENFDNIETRVKEIYEVEQEGDILTHEIMKKLNKTFITPIDREDLYALSSRLDDVIDLIWSAADRIAVFKVRETTQEAISMSKDLLATTEAIHKAIRKLKEKKYSHVQEYCIEINRLENRVDRDFRDALGKLFDEITDPILIIK